MLLLMPMTFYYKIVITEYKLNTKTAHAVLYNTLIFSNL